MTSAAASPPPSFLSPPPGSTRSWWALLRLSATRPGGRRTVSVLTVVLLLAGVSLFAYPAITDLIGKGRQLHVQSQFDNPQFKTEYQQHKVAVGDGLTQLIISNDRVHVNTLVVEGTTPAALRAGSGHYLHTPFPCEKGNVAIAGHRTTYSRPFNRINEMRPGDTIVLVTPFQRCTYRVVPGFDHHANPWVVQPTDVAVVGQAGALGTGHWLTLTSCHPKGSASHRIILRAILAKVEPVGGKSASPTPSGKPA